MPSGSFETLTVPALSTADYCYQKLVMLELSRGDALSYLLSRRSGIAKIACLIRGSRWAGEKCPISRDSFSPSL